MRVTAATLSLVAWVLMIPSTAWAQATIAGAVRDTSGAALPGVNVEATSSALIEKVRAAVTDSTGQYRIEDLRPGTYTVTFSLAGFSTVRREGLELPDAFTATVNADLRVGALEETLTVSGQAPTVDVQSAAQRTILSSQVLDSLPSSRFLHGYVMYLPGMSGVTLGLAAHLARDISFHGSRSGQFIIQVDGFSTAFMSSYSGISSSFFLNQAIVQETSIQTGGASAEQQFGERDAHLPAAGKRFDGLVEIRLGKPEAFEDLGHAQVDAVAFLAAEEFGEVVILDEQRFVLAVGQRRIGKCVLDAIDFGACLEQRLESE